MTSLPRSDRPTHGQPSPAGQPIIPAPICHSRAGRNPRTFPPPKNVNRDTTNYDHTDTPESGFPIGYPGDVIPLPDPAPDSTAGGGANHTRIPSPCGTVHRGLIVKAGTSCAGARPQPTARRQPRHRICSLSLWERVRVRVNKPPLRIRRHCRGDSRIADCREAAYPGHPLSTRAEPHKQWYNQTYVRLMRYRPLTRQPQTIRKTCFCKTKVQIEARQECQ